MSMAKRTYALPEGTAESFEAVVEPGRRSTVVAGLIKEWLEERERRRLRAAVLEGCQEMAAEYVAIEKEFHPLEEEVAHGESLKSKARRSGSGSAGSNTGGRAGR